MSVSVFSINARGFRDLLKRKALFHYCQGKCAVFCFIQESHACSEAALFWKKQWESEVRFPFGTNQSTGAAILTGRLGGQILTRDTDNLGQWIILVVEINHTLCILVNSYATNNCLIFQDIETTINQLFSKYPAKIICLPLNSS